MGKRYDAGATGSFGLQVAGSVDDEHGGVRVLQSIPIVVLLPHAEVHGLHHPAAWFALPCYWNLGHGRVVSAELGVQCDEISFRLGEYVLEVDVILQPGRVLRGPTATPGLASTRRGNGLLWKWLTNPYLCATIGCVDNGLSEGVF